MRDGVDMVEFRDTES